MASVLYAFKRFGSLLSPERRYRRTCLSDMRRKDKKPINKNKLFSRSTLVGGRRCQEAGVPTISCRWLITRCVTVLFSHRNLDEK